MQTLSNMRRNITHKNDIIPFGWAVFLIVYQMATPLYTFLTPLIGFMVCYLVFLKDEQEKTHEDDSIKTYLSFAYLIYIDLNKGFYLFSGVIFFALFYRIFAEWLETSFKCKNCIIITHVVAGYIGIFGINNLIAYTLNESFFHFGWEYGLYIFLDSFIAMLVFRDKLL